MSREKRKKHPKLMVVTTVLMVLLLIASISTATFAWFTANSIVTIDTLTFTAEHNGSSEISISWEQYVAGARKNQISLDTSHDLKPCIPNILPNNTTSFASYRTTFRGATIGMPQGGTETDPTVKVFNENGSPEQPFVSTNPDNSTQHHFYVTNHGDTATNITVYFQAVYDTDGDGTPDVENENIGLLRMSIFTGTTSGNLTYHSTIVADGETEALASTPDTHYGTIVKNADPTNFETISTTTSTLPITIAPNNGFVVFALVAWYDGVYLDELGAGLSAHIQVFFKG